MARTDNPPGRYGRFPIHCRVRSLACRAVPPDSGPMRRLLILPMLALAGVAAAPAHADAPGSAVPILYDAFGAPRVDVLAGDTVTWRNASLRPHAVVAVDQSWSSERLAPSGAYSRQFDTPGPVSYYCQLHPSMRGEVDVHRLLLDAPKDSAAAGRPYTLSG